MFLAVCPSGLIAQGKLRIVGQDVWRDVVYFKGDGWITIMDPIDLILLIADKDIYIQFEDGTIRRGVANKGGRVVFMR